MGAVTEESEGGFEGRGVTVGDPRLSLVVTPPQRDQSPGM